MYMLPPSGVMGSLWKDAYTSPQPTACSLLCLLPRSETQSVLVSCSNPVRSRLADFYVCHKDKGSFVCLFVCFQLFVLFVLNSYLALSIKHDKFYCLNCHLLFGVSVLSWDCFSKWVCGPAAPASVGAWWNCRVSGPTADLNQTLPLNKIPWWCLCASKWEKPCSTCLSFPLTFPWGKYLRGG